MHDAKCVGRHLGRDDLLCTGTGLVLDSIWKGMSLGDYMYRITDEVYNVSHHVSCFSFICISCFSTNLY